MSRLRRLNQIKRAMPTLGAQVASAIKKHWRQIFGFIGVSGLFDLIREFARAKAMDWIYQNLGSVGIWLASYKLAGVTIGIIIVIVLVTVSVIKEARVRESTILDPTGTPYQIRTVSKVWARSSVAVSCALVVLLVYGAYRFYSIAPQVLLEKYPFGYVIFDLDNRNSVFPYQTQSLLDRWEFDWSAVKFIENTPKDVAIRGPNISGPGLRGVGIEIGGPKKVGVLPATFFTDGIIAMKAEILAIRKDGVVFLIGFARARPRPAPLL